jgi:putative ABC transport system permease protein
MVGILAGIYPSLYLSSFEPVSVLKGVLGSVNRMSGKTLKKVLTVAQFTFSLIFIITSFILFQQFKFMGQTDYGFNKENIINIALQDISFKELKYKLENMPEVESIAASSKVPAMGSISGMWLSANS